MNNHNDTPPETSVSIKIPFKTVFSVLAILVFVAAIRILAPMFMTLFLSILVSVALMPILNWLVQHKVPRWLGIMLIAVCLSAAIIGFCATMLPKLFEEFSIFIDNLPKIKAEILQYISVNNPMRPLLEQNLTKKAMVPEAKNFSMVFAAGNAVFSGFLEVALVFIFAIYLLSDGPGLIDWIKAFFSIPTQEKIELTTTEVSKIIFSYMSGLVICSTLCFIFVFVSMLCLHVPNALLLGVIAGVFDVLPVLGLFISLIPALIFGFTVSADTALIILGLYLIYHAIENYFIVPYLYGNRLRVPSFVILVSLLSAGLLAGVEGAVAILPIVASYPIFEKIWLKKVVRSQTIVEHSKNQTSKV